MRWIDTLFVLLLPSLAHSHPCDEEHGSLCPQAGPEGLGWCLESKDSDALSASCRTWLGMNQACSDEMASKCPGAAFTNDAELCLTKWNRPDDFSSECAATIPQIPVPHPRSSTSVECNKDS